MVGGVRVVHLQLLWWSRPLVLESRLIQDLQEETHGQETKITRCLRKSRGSLMEDLLLVGGGPDEPFCWA